MIPPGRPDALVDLRTVLDAGHRLDRVEALGLLGLVADVGVDQERVDFAMDIFDGDLEAVEAARLGPLDLRREVPVCK